MTNFKNLEAVLNLVASTSDRVIVVSESHEPFMIMSLADYQALLPKTVEIKDLNQQEMLEKINRDIALWRSSQSIVPVNEDFNLEQFKVDLPKSSDTKVSTPANPSQVTTEEEEKYYIEPVD